MAMAAASMLSAHSKKKKEMQAAVNNAKLQRAKLKQARVDQAGDFATNTQRMRQASQKRDIAIEENALRAEAGLESAFAGGGISGTSVDELDSELSASVSKNKFENKQALDTQLSDAQKQNTRANENINSQAADIGAGAPTGGGFGEALAAGASGFQQGGDLASGINKAVGGTFNINDSIGNLFSSDMAIK